jgi:hypothetical protein
MRRKILLLLALSFGLCVVGLGQTQVITGKVKDEQGTPLIGASVAIKGTKKKCSNRRIGLI